MKSNLENKDSSVEIQNQIPNSSIREDSEIHNVISNSSISTNSEDDVVFEPVDRKYSFDEDTAVSIEDKEFTLSQLKEVWYLGMFNGATLWQVCQDNTSDPVSSIQKVAYELLQAVKSEQSIKDLSNNNMMLLGVACEVLGIEELK